MSPVPHPSVPPTGIDAHAPAVARHEAAIAAPLDVVWRLHTDVDAWPTWQPDITTARLDGPFAPGSSFTWQTFGLDVTSHVYRVDGADAVGGGRARRTFWGGPARGILGLHAWTFTAVPGGVRAHTEESWSGAPVDADARALQAALDAALAAWLGYLKAAAERAAAA